MWSFWWFKSTLIWIQGFSHRCFVYVAVVCSFLHTEWRVYSPTVLLCYFSWLLWVLKWSGQQSYYLVTLTTMSSKITLPSWRDLGYGRWSLCALCFCQLLIFEPTRNIKVRVIARCEQKNKNQSGFFYIWYADRVHALLVELVLISLACLIFKFYWCNLNTNIYLSVLLFYLKLYSKSSVFSLFNQCQIRFCGVIYILQIIDSTHLVPQSHQWSMWTLLVQSKCSQKSGLLHRPRLQ